MTDDELAALTADLTSFCKGKGLALADAQDIAQDALTRLYASAPELKGEDARAWTYRVAGRLIIDRGRALSRREVLLDNVAPLVRTTTADTADTVAFIEGVTLLLQTLGTLSERDRQVITLLDLQEQPRAEVAQELGVTPKTLTKIQERARKALRKEFVKAGGTAAAFAVLFPALRATGRLHSSLVAAATIPALAAATVLLPHVSPFAEALAGPRPAPFVVSHYPNLDEINGADILHGTGTAVSSRLGAGAAGQLHGNSAGIHAGRRNKIDPTPWVPTCDSGKRWNGVCEGPTDPNMFTVGVMAPDQVCKANPEGTCGGQVAQNEVSPPVDPCPMVKTVPYIICQKGA